jgi:tetratricopeptide (TPR) repeat protein
LTPEEQKRQAAKKLFVRAAVQHRQDRYLEAIASLEECARLDPDSAPPLRLLTSLYRQVGRTDDALICARQVTQLHPDQVDGWQRLADLLQEAKRPREAADALEKASTCPELTAHPDQSTRLLQRLADWFEEMRDWDAVVRTETRLLGVLESSRGSLKRSGFLTEAEWTGEKAAALGHLGRAQFKRRDLAAAEAALVQALRLNSSQTDSAGERRAPRFHFYMAEIDAERNHPERALEHLRTYLQTSPKDIEPYRLLSAMYDKLDRSNEKLRELEAFARRAPSNLLLQLLLAEQHAAARNFSEAENLYLRLAKDHPKAEVYNGLFGLYQQNQAMDAARRKLDEQLAVSQDKSKSDEARAEANKHVQAMYAVLRENPRMLLALLPLAQREQLRQFRNQRNFEYRTFEILVSLAARSGELEAAERLLREVLSEARGRFQTASIHEALIQILLAQHKHHEVVELCSVGGRGDDNRFMYNYYMALPLVQLGRADDGLAAIEQAVLLAHSDAAKLGAILRKVDILTWIGRYEDGRAECSAALKEFPRPDQTRQVRLRLAAVFSAQREYPKAEEQLRILLERDANDARVCNDLGYQLADQNRKLDEAERLIRRALSLDRSARANGESEEDSAEYENAAYVDSLGWVLFRRGKLAEARQALEKAAGLPDGKEDPNIWDHLGDVLFQLGESEKAKFAWQSARKLYLEERRSKKDGRLDEVERKLKIARP